jgi:hypothetical protein
MLLFAAAQGARVPTAIREVKRLRVKILQREMDSRAGESENFARAHTMRDGARQIPATGAAGCAHKGCDRHANVNAVTVECSVTRTSRPHRNAVGSRIDKERRLTLFAIAALLRIAALVLTLLTIAAAFLVALAALAAAARLLIRADLGLAGLLRGALLLAGLTAGLIFLGLLIAALLLT